MRRFVALLILGLLAAPAWAETWYAPGSYNSFSTDLPVQLIDSGDGVFFTKTISGLFTTEPDNDYELKIATAGFALEAPPGFGQNVRTWADTAGEIDIRFWDDTSWDDGWMPNNQRRVGYVDKNLFDWEVMGSFNGFSTGLPLTDQTNGLHTGTFTFNKGNYNWKFRKVNDWNINIGNNGFSASAGDNAFAVLNDGEEWTFKLDLPNGRWLLSPLGDHNNDKKVNAGDYVTWRKNPAAYGGAQGYTDWRSNYGAGEFTGTLFWQARGPQIPAIPLVDQGGGTYSLTIGSLTALTDYELKVERSDLSESYPGSNIKIRSDTNGDIKLKFYDLQTANWGDGWSPDTSDRVGYEDHNQFDWEIMGSFNGFTSPVAQLTDQGNGLHTGTYTIDTAGTHQFKFRQQGDWNTSIGADFGNSAGNASLTTAAASETWVFELNLPLGKWRAFKQGLGTGATVPEPASFVLALVGLALMGMTRRKK